MSLFVGRLPPHNFDDRDLEDLFYKYGKITKCQLKKGSRFAFGFIEFEDPEDIYDAIRDNDGLDIDGVRIVVEKAKGPERRRNDSSCFNCGEDGHWARDCRRSRRDLGYDRQDYRSRSPDRRHHSRDDYYRSNSRRYYSRSRSPYDDRRGRSYSRSPSPPRGYSRSPSPRRDSPPPPPPPPSNMYQNEQQPLSNEYNGNVNHD